MCAHLRKSNPWTRLVPRRIILSRALNGERGLASRAQITERPAVSALFNRQWLATIRTLRFAARHHALLLKAPPAQYRPCNQKPWYQNEMRKRDENAGNGGKPAHPPELSSSAHARALVPALDRDPASCPLSAHRIHADFNFCMI